jgi:hypothetical protein
MPVAKGTIKDPVEDKRGVADASKVASGCDSDGDGMVGEKWPGPSWGVTCQRVRLPIGQRAQGR